MVMTYICIYPRKYVTVFTSIYLSFRADTQYIQVMQFVHPSLWWLESVRLVLGSLGVIF